VERQTAVEIARHLRKLDGPMNEAMAAVEKIGDPAQRRVFRRALAAVVGAIYIDLFVPIGREFPDLLPDKQDVDGT
jgi:hypothetical protein